jgi:hypothetical protein
MRELVLQRLQKVRATVYWKDYAPTHFGGRTGTFTGIDEANLAFLGVRENCPAATHGEFW